MTLFQGRLERFFNRVCSQFFVLNAREHPGDGSNRGILFMGWQFSDGHRQGLPGLIDAVQGQQDLEQIPIGFCGLGDGAFPGLCSLECRIPRARLQRHIHSPLKHQRVTGFASSIQNDGETAAGGAAAHVHFAQQELVKKHGIQRRFLDSRFGWGRGLWRGSLRRCALSDQ